MDVQFSLDTTANSASFKRSISYSGNLEQAQKDRLLAIANACPVQKTLNGTIKIETRIV